MYPKVIGGILSTVTFKVGCGLGGTQVAMFNISRREVGEILGVLGHHPDIGMATVRDYICLMRDIVLGANAKPTVGD